MRRPELPTESLKGIHVLVVEDDEDSRVLLATMLQYCGALVTAVASAVEAMSTLTRVKPDVVVSDLSMPERDGYWLIRAIRELPADRGGAIPAIVVTALGDPGSAERTLAAGFHAYLRKPVDPWELARTVAGLAGRPR